ncbi:MAG: response regulator, partial [Elusimicrobiota bacterium]
MASILVVDDERDVVTLIKFLLEKDGHTVSTAYNGAEALEILFAAAPKPTEPLGKEVRPSLGEEVPPSASRGEGGQPPKAVGALPDLVILDVMMPQVDGYTASRKLADNPATRPVPIIILTAKGQMQDLFDSSPNVASYVEKPFDP